MSWWSAGPHLWHINIINHARQLFYFQSSKKSYVTMEQFPWSYTKIKDLPCLISSEERPYKWLVSVADKLFTSFFFITMTLLLLHYKPLVFQQNCFGNSSVIPSPLCCYHLCLYPAGAVAGCQQSKWPPCHADTDRHVLPSNCEASGAVWFVP